MSVFKKLAGQTALYGLSSIVGRLLNYLLVPLYTRVFDTEEYGIVTQLYVFVAFLNILFTYGLETAYFRYTREEKEPGKVYSTALLSIIVTSVVMAFVIGIFAGNLSGWIGLNAYNQEDISLYIRWFAAIIALDAITAIPFARLRLENKAGRFVIVRLINISLNILLNLFFLVLCPHLAKGPDVPTWLGMVYDPTMGIAYVFLSNLVASLITVLILSKEIFRIQWIFDKALWKRMIVYAFPLMIAGFAGMINEGFDRLMLPVLLKDPTTAMSQLGIYGACYKISIIMTLFIQTFRYAAEPFFFSQAGKEDARQTYAHVMNGFVMVCSFIFLFVLLYMDLFQHFIGEEFRSGLKVVPVLLLANMFLGMYYNLSIWYKLTGKTIWGAWLSVFGAAITLLFNFLLIPPLGYMGAAWATLICYASMMLFGYVMGQRFYPVPYNIRPFIHYLLSALIIWQISVFLEEQKIFSGNMLLVVNTVLLLLYVLLALLFERRKNGYLRRPQSQTGKSV